MQFTKTLFDISILLLGHLISCNADVCLHSQMQLGGCPSCVFVFFFVPGLFGHWLNDLASSPWVRFNQPIPLCI